MTCVRVVCFVRAAIGFEQNVNWGSMTAARLHNECRARSGKGVFAHLEAPATQVTIRRVLVGATAPSHPQGLQLDPVGTHTHTPC
jgi:hypothetical protein